MGKALLAGALVVSVVAVVAPAVSASTPPTYFVRANGLFANNCKSFALTGINKACTLQKALLLATAPTDTIRMKGGVYGVGSDDTINAPDLTAANTGVTIRGGYDGGGPTILEPGATCAGNAVVDLSPVNKMRIERLTVDSTTSACSSAVANAGGTADVVGAAASGQRVFVNGVTGTNPAIAVNLTGGSTTLDNVRIGQLAPAYSADGIVCTGAGTHCTVVQSKAIGGSGTTGIAVTSGAVATIKTSTISGNGDGGVVATAGSQSNGTTVTNNVITGTSAVGIELEAVGGLTITGNTITTAGAGPGILLVGSDNDSISINTASNTEIGVYVGGNDVAGSSTGNTISNNNFSSNLLGGAVADGYGSPETWNRAGTGNQGIQGEVFFQNDSNAPIPSAPVTNFLLVAGPGAATNTADFDDVALALPACTTLGAGAPVDGQPGLLACGGSAVSTPVTVPGNVYVTGTNFPNLVIPAENGSATGANPGSCSSPDSGPTCTLTVSALPSVATVAQGNTFTLNIWQTEGLFGAIDGSGPNGEAPPPGSATYPDQNPAAPATIENTWTNNTGSPANAPCNPTTAFPEC